MKLLTCKFLYILLGNLCFKFCIKYMTELHMKRKSSARKGISYFLNLFLPYSPYTFDVPRRNPWYKFQLTFVLYIFCTTAKHIIDLFFQVINKDVDRIGCKINPTGCTQYKKLCRQRPNSFPDKSPGLNTVPDT